MILIWRKIYFCAGPELYHDAGDWHNLHNAANMRYESESSCRTFIKNLATATHISSSERYIAHAVSSSPLVSHASRIALEEIWPTRPCDMDQEHVILGIDEHDGISSCFTNLVGLFGTVIEGKADGVVKE